MKSVGIIWQPGNLPKSFRVSVKKSQKSNISSKICFRLFSAESCQLFSCHYHFFKTLLLGSCPSVLKVLRFPFPTVRIEPGQCEALVFHCSLPSVSWVVFSLAKEKFVQISLLRTEVFPSLSHQCSRTGEIPWSEPRTQQRLVASDF